MAEFRFPIWTRERIEQGKQALSTMTPVQLSYQRDPDVVAYILDLRGQVELWKSLYNQKLSNRVRRAPWLMTSTAP